MTNIEENHKIGDLVYSSVYGIGIILDIEVIEDATNHYTVKWSNDDSRETYTENGIKQFKKRLSEQTKNNQCSFKPR
jgi:hypothetical protein